MCRPHFVPVRLVASSLLWGIIIFALDIIFQPPIIFHPASGAAVVALLLGGGRVLPAIFAGSLGAGLYMGTEAGLAVYQAVLDSAQALLIMELISRKLMSTDTPLAKDRELLLYSLVFCPLVAALSTGMRAVPGLPAGDTLLFRWMALSLGLIAATPIFLSLASEKAPWSRRRISVAAPTAALILFCFYGRALVQDSFDRSIALSLASRAEAVAGACQSQLLACEEGLRGMTPLAQAVEQIDMLAFRPFAQRYLEQNPIVTAVGWAPKVSVSSPQSEVELSIFPLTLVLPQDDSYLHNKKLSSLPKFGEKLESVKVEETVFVSLVPEEDQAGDRFLVLIPSFAISRTGEDKELLGYFCALVSAQKIAAATELLVPDEWVAGVQIQMASEESKGAPALVATEGEISVNGPQASSSCELANLRITAQAFGALRADNRPRMGLPIGIAVMSTLQFFFIMLSNGTLRIENLRKQVEARAEKLEELNSNLAEANEAARKADQAKSLFLASMSHEIRTPMNGILGLSRVLIGSKLSPAQEEQLRHIISSAEALQSTLSGILDFSTIDSGEALLSPEPQVLDQLLQDTVRTFLLAAEEKELELSLRVARDVPAVVDVDGSRLRQIVLNLLGNAVKYTHVGEIEVVLEVDSQVASDFTLRMSIRDTGVGIPEDQVTAVFDAFSQVAGSDGEAGGVGLGLAISSRLVEMMGGELSVESSLGRGSVFSFTFTCREIVSTPHSFPRALNPGQLSVFIGVKHSTRRDALIQYFEDWGFQLSSERTGASLSVLDETSLDRPGKEQTPRIVLLTATRLVRTYDLCRTQGAIPLPLPVTRKALAQSVAEAFGQSGEPEASEVTSDQLKPYLGLQALVADDNQTNRLLASLLLEQLGFKVTLAEDGLQAVEAAKDHVFDVIIMDVRMPHLDGLGAARQIRDLRIQTPIIAATAHLQVTHKDEALQSGMNAMLAKPLTVENLEKVLKLYLSGPTNSFQEGALLKAVGGDRASAVAVAESFLEEMPKLLEGITTAEDAESLSSAKHSLRGTVRVFGAGRLLGALARLDWGMAQPVKEKIQACIAEETRKLSEDLREFTNRGKT